MNNISSSLLLIFTIIGSVLVYYFLYPLLFVDNLTWAYFVTFTIVNVAAILLSWVYFDQTRCYQYEGNFIAKILYYLYGHTVAHIILIAFRVFTNVTFYFTIFGLDVSLFNFDIVIPSQSRIFWSLPIGIFTAELIFNIYAICTGWDEKCEPGDPVICLNPDSDSCSIDDEKIRS